VQRIKNVFGQRGHPVQDIRLMFWYRADFRKERKYARRDYPPVIILMTGTLASFLPRPASVDNNAGG
jgi:hypothetical protein